MNLQMPKLAHAHEWLDIILKSFSVSVAVRRSFYSSICFLKYILIGFLHEKNRYKYCIFFAYLE